MSKLSKSLSELDAMADELLSKSCCASGDVVKKSEAEDNDELKPEDVSENVPEDEVQETDAEQKKEDEAEASGEKETSEDEKAEETEVKKSDDVEDLEKCDGGDVTKIAKSEEEAEDDESEELEKAEDEGDIEEDEAEEKEELAKSFQSTFEQNPDIQKSIDASAFLSAVTEILSKSMADVCYDIRKNADHVDGSSEVLAKSLQASLQLNKSMAEEIDVLKSQNAILKDSIEKSFADFKDFMEGRFEEFSHQPSTMRKSLGAVNVHERNFAKSLDLGAGMNLSKSEVLAKMSNLVMQGNPIVTSQDIISYESGAPMRPEVSQLIYNG